MAGRYSRSGGPNLGVFLKAHTGDGIRVDRTGRPPEFIKRPTLTLGLAIQPDVLTGLATRPAFRGRGLIGRILFVVPESGIGRRSVDPPCMPPYIATDYAAMILGLLRLPTGTDA